MQLCFVEEAFRTLKGDLGLWPIFHQRPDRIEAHSFVAFLAYCLSITLRQQPRGVAGRLMPRTVFEKLATVQMLDVRVPTMDGRELLLTRHTEPSADVMLLLDQLGLRLPPQPPPKIRTPTPTETTRAMLPCSPDLCRHHAMNQPFPPPKPSSCRSRGNTQTSLSDPGSTSVSGPPYEESAPDAFGFLPVHLRICPSNIQSYQRTLPKFYSGALSMMRTNKHPNSVSSYSAILGHSPASMVNH